MKQNKTIFKQISDRYYKGEDGRTMRLDEKTQIWSILDREGKTIDCGAWRYELAERNGIQLKA